MTEISLDEEVKKNLPGVMNLIKDSQAVIPTSDQRVVRKTLYNEIIDDACMGTRNSVDQVNYQCAIETALSVFKTAARAIRVEMNMLGQEERLTVMDHAITERDTAMPASPTPNPAREERDALRQSISQQKLVANRYALQMAGNIGLAMLDLGLQTTKLKANFAPDEVVSEDMDSLVAKLVKAATKDIYAEARNLEARNEQMGDENLKEVLGYVFTSWVNQFSWSTYQDVAKLTGLDTTLLRYDSYSMKAGQFKGFKMVVNVEGFMNINNSDVIGGKVEGSLGDVIDQALFKLGEFDLEKGTNPGSPPYVVFVHGPPGCGKTFVAHAKVQSFAELCRKKGIPFWGFTHSATDYATEFQNQSSNNLRKMAMQISNFQGLVVGYVSDGDIIFQSRKDSHITQDQKMVMGEYFKIFDGTYIKKHRNVLWIIDANYIEGIDPATQSRLFDLVYEHSRFKTAEEYAELVRRDIKSKTGGDAMFPPEEYKKIGQYLLDCPMSTREIGNVLKQITGGFRATEEMVGRPAAENLAVMATYIKSVTPERIIAGIDGHIKRLDSMRQQSEQAMYGTQGGLDANVERLLRMKADLDEKYARENDPTKQATG